MPLVGPRGAAPFGPPFLSLGRVAAVPPVDSAPYAPYVPPNPYDDGVPRPEPLGPAIGMLSLGGPIHGLLLPPMSWVSYALAGVSRDNTGAIDGGCTMLLFDQAWNLLAQTVSDATTGAWSFPFPNNQFYNVACLKRGTPNVAGLVLDKSASEVSTGGGGSAPPTTIATILGADTRVWYSNQKTGSGATLKWIDEQTRVDISTVGTAPTAITVGAASNVGMRLGTTGELSNASTLLTGSGAGNTVNRVIYGCAFKVAGATAAGQEGAIFTGISGANGTTFKMSLPDTGKIECLFQGTGTSYAIYDSNSSYVDSTWRTAIAVWNATTGLAQMYINGVLQTGTDSTAAGVRLADGDLQIYAGQTSNSSMNGDVVSPFLAWNVLGTAYTAQQIADLHAYLIGLTV